MNAMLLLNQDAGALNAGRDAATPPAVVEEFERRGVRVTLRRAKSPDLRSDLESAIAEQPDALFVGGGDGTISTAAGCLVDSAIPLGVVPLGTLNHFARDLGLSTEWREAIAALAGGTIRTVDVGEVNGCVFINNCSLGSYPAAVRRREILRHQRGRSKAFAMLLASLQVLRRLRRLRLQIELDGTTLALRTPFVFIGNNRYSGHVLDHSMRPRLDEGRLWIYTTRARRRFTLLRLVWQSLIRRIDAADALETHATTEATITPTGDRPLPVALDGELANLTAPLRCRIRPQSLRVIAPCVSET